MIEDGIKRFAPPSESRGQKPTFFVFELAGERLHALSEAPAGVMNDLLAGVDIDPSGSRIYRAPNLIRYMQGVVREQEPLTPEEARDRDIDKEPESDGLVWVPADDLVRFNRVVYSKKVVVQVEVLGDLVMWLAEKQGARPTQPSGA